MQHLRSFTKVPYSKISAIRYIFSELINAIFCSLLLSKENHPKEELTIFKVWIVLDKIKAF